jgi:hypothetical protein
VLIVVACAVALWLLTMIALVLLGGRSKAQGRAYGLSLKAGGPEPAA